jgi:hypothetical protein
MWEDLAETLVIQPTLGSPLSKPQDKDLELLEKQSGFQLPVSFREFVKRFGPGEIGRYFRIYSPRCGKKVSQADLYEYVQSFENNRIALAKCFKEEGLIRRMVPFSDTIGGDVIAWDPEDVTDATTHEYGIYLIPRSDTRVVRLVDSFEAFIEAVCLGKLFPKKVKVRNWKVFQEFVPYGSRSD